MCVRPCVRACVRACVGACVGACVRACVRVCVCVCVHGSLFHCVLLKPNPLLDKSHVLLFIYLYIYLRSFAFRAKCSCLLGDRSFSQALPDGRLIFSPSLAKLPKIPGRTMYLTVQILT